MNLPMCLALSATTVRLTAQRRALPGKDLLDLLGDLVACRWDAFILCFHDGLPSWAVHCSEGD